MPEVKPSPIGNYGDQFVDNNGNPLAGGKLYFFEAGTTTPRSTWTTNLGDVLNTNPLILGVDGRIQSDGVWLEYGYAYKVVLYNSADVLQDSWDNVIGVEVGPEGASPITETLEAYTYNAGAVEIDVEDATGFAVGSYAVITDGTNRTSGTITALTSDSITFQPFVLLPPGDAGSGTVYAIGSTIAVAGAQGATGRTGTWVPGAGAPDPADGENGDMYLNVTTGDVYGPKTAGAWGGIVGNIQGPAANLSDADPEPIGTTDPGVSNLAARADHVHEGFGTSIAMDPAVPGVSVKEYVDEPFGVVYIYDGRRLEQVDQGDIRLILNWSGNYISTVVYQNPPGTPVATYTPTYAGRNITAWVKS